MSRFMLRMPSRQRISRQKFPFSGTLSTFVEPREKGEHREEDLSYFSALETFSLNYIYS